MVNLANTKHKISGGGETFTEKLHVLIAPTKPANKFEKQAGL